MSGRLGSVRQERPWLDIVSYGRGGAGRQVKLNASQREQIARIVDRTPEVVVKVTGGGRNVKQVKDEVGYFGRDGSYPWRPTMASRCVGKESRSS